MNVNETDDGKWNSENVDRLLDIAKKSQGLSGRSLRKLPLLAHAWFVNSDKVELSTFLDVLEDSVDKHFSDTIGIGKKK